MAKRQHIRRLRPARRSQWARRVHNTPIADIQALRVRAGLVSGPFTVTIHPAQIRAYLIAHPESEFAQQVVAYLDAHPEIEQT